MSSFTPINQRDVETGEPSGTSSFAEAVTPQAVTEAGPSNPRRSTRQEKQLAKRVNKSMTIITPTFLRLEETHGIEPLLSGLLAEQKTTEGKSSTFRKITEAVESAQDLVDEVTQTVWGPVASKANIWKDVGGEENYKKEMHFDEGPGPRIARIQMNNTRKANARASGAEMWGENWEEEFDAQEKRLQKPGQHVLQGMVAMGKAGWPIKVIWIGMDLAFRVRIQGRSHNNNKFVEGDVMKCKDWLWAIASEKRKEEVGLAELIEMLPREMRAPEALRARAKEKEREKRKGKGIEAAPTSPQRTVAPLSSRSPTPGPSLSPTPGLSSPQSHLRTVTSGEAAAPSPPAVHSSVLEHQGSPTPEQKHMATPSALSPDLQTEPERILFEIKTGQLLTIPRDTPYRPVRLEAKSLGDLWHWGFDPKRVSIDVETGKLLIRDGKPEERMVGEGLVGLEEIEEMEESEEMEQEESGEVEESEVMEELEEVEVEVEVVEEQKETEEQEEPPQKKRRVFSWANAQEPRRSKRVAECKKRT